MKDRKAITQSGGASLAWQSKAVLLTVAPWTAAQLVLEIHAWTRESVSVTWTTLAVCGILGLLVWRMRSGTLAAAGLGAAIMGCLMYATAQSPYASLWRRGALWPVLAVMVLTLAATRVGRARKAALGFAEGPQGRNAAQVAANLGAAALVVTLGPLIPLIGPENPMFTAMLAYAALAEAAADTVSSELGQVFGGQPRLLTTLRRVAPGTDGGITIAGTAAGIVAAAAVAAVGIWSMTGSVAGNWMGFGVILLGGVFGLFFDSLLGATLERRGWLNNDAVNFLGTLSAAGFALAVGQALAGFLRG